MMSTDSKPPNESDSTLSMVAHCKALFIDQCKNIDYAKDVCDG